MVDQESDDNVCGRNMDDSGGDLVVANRSREVSLLIRSMANRWSLVHDWLSIGGNGVKSVGRGYAFNSAWN